MIKEQETICGKKAIARRNLMDLLQIEKKCPALANQIAKSYETGKNINQQYLVNVFMLNISEYV